MGSFFHFCYDSDTFYLLEFNMRSTMIFSSALLFVSACTSPKSEESNAEKWEKMQDRQEAMVSPQTPDDVDLMASEVETQAGLAHYTGVIYENRWEDFGPFIVDGEGLQISVNGDGDVDLYVAKGRTPYADDNDCSSMTLTGQEHCDLDDEGVYYVAIYGYDGNVNYTVDVTYSVDSEGLVSLPSNNLAYDAEISATEGRSDTLNDGDRMDAWFSDGPLGDGEIYVEEKFDREEFIENILIDWVPGMSSEWAHVLVENRGTIIDVGRLLIEGRRTTFDIQLEGSRIEIILENSDEQYVGIRQIWTW
jgi:hypothetical protein